MKLLKPIGLFLAVLFAFLWVIAVLFTGELRPYEWGTGAKAMFLSGYAFIGLVVSTCIAMEVA